MDTRQRNIAGEIARLEAALRRECDAVRGALELGSRQALRLNLAVAHEELGRSTGGCTPWAPRTTCSSARRSTSSMSRCRTTARAGREGPR